MKDKDYLWLHLRDLPYFRAMLRAVEAKFYKDLELAAPTLDIGCGDGHFASIAFDRKLDVGLDNWEEPLAEAHKRGVYHTLIKADASRIPYPKDYFGCIVSNSVLEHIPAIDAVITEAGRVLKKGGVFYFCVPNHQFNPALSGTRWLNALGMTSLAARYQQLYDRVARHQHLDAPDVWSMRLESNGFRVERWWHYFSPAALSVLEWGHLFGLPSLLVRKLTGRWHLVRQPWNFALTRRLVEFSYREAVSIPDGVCTFYITRKL